MDSGIHTATGGNRFAVEATVNLAEDVEAFEVAPAIVLSHRATSTLTTAMPTGIGTITGLSADGGTGTAASADTSGEADRRFAGTHATADDSSAGGSQ